MDSSQEPVISGSANLDGDEAIQNSNSPDSTQCPSTNTTTINSSSTSGLTVDTNTSTTNNSTGSKNIKNMSIKEFFTTRLMKNKSFDINAGNAHSPKDETTNWFDEFKARMIKKSQKSSNLASTNLNQEDNHSEESNDSGDNGGRHKRNNKSRFKSKLTVTSSSTSSPSSSKYVTKQDQCDSNNLSVLNESLESLNEMSSKDDHLMSQSRDSISYKHPSRIFSLRSRKVQRISCVDKPDFDTASINTIYDRRDSRIVGIGNRTSHIVFNRLTIYFYRILKLVVSNLLPFNYTLPWKLISAVMLSLVILVIGFTASASPENGIFSFVNGFFCGISIATACFIVTFLSLIIRILPDSRNRVVVNRHDGTDQYDRAKSIFGSNQRCAPNRGESTDTSTKLSDDKTVIPNLHKDDYTFNETLEPLDNESTSRASDPSGIDDESYKGWMIEFVGDYELRNRGEVKLKLLYVKFEHRVLYLYKVKSNQDIESSSFPSNVQQRMYDLKTVRNFSVNLLFPKNVRNLKKWLWSKKYPIKIEFIQRVDPTDLPSESPSKKSPSEYRTIQLTLFTKTCREKEEWFRRFKKIVEEIRLAQVTENSFRYPIVGSLVPTTEADATSLPPYLSHSNRSSKRDFSNLQAGVQTSRSSTILDSDSKILTECKNIESSQQGLIRTKSYEFIHDDSSDKDSLSQVTQDNWNQDDSPDHNDSTLTPANVIVYSQHVEDLNFIETRPNIDYRDYIERIIRSSEEATPSSDWFNALSGRIFFDVFSQNYWSYWFKRKIQRKLHRIRLPYFMDTLTLTNIDLGSNAPQFLNVVSHQFDSFGLSIDFDMSYAGGLTMTFETKLNLLKMKPDQATNDNNPTITVDRTSTDPQQTGASPATKTDATSKDHSSSVSDFSSQDGSNTGTQLNSSSSQNKKEKINPPSVTSTGSGKPNEESTGHTTSDSSGSDSDSSSDSSSDEADIDEISDWEDYGAEKTRQNLVKLVDKIASSRYFQQATENRYIKKKLLDISNCPLILVVKIESLSGILTFNIPPPQTDRVWYGFKPNPELILKAMPRMGDREVSLSHVTDWIERKLEEEFRKILVIPNMEDFVLPVLKSDHLLYVAPSK